MSWATHQPTQWKVRNFNILHLSADGDIFIIGIAESVHWWTAWYFVDSPLPGLDWIERENFLDVHLTRNRPPPARRRRSGPSQRTSYRRAGQAQALYKKQNVYFDTVLENKCSFQNYIIWLKYCDQSLSFHSRLAITQPLPSPVPTEHISWRLARASWVSSLCCWAGFRVGLYGWPIPWRNVWGSNDSLVLQSGERHTSHSGGDILSLPSLHYIN